MSSAGSELATIVSALVGAVVAMRRSRRAQRTITKLDALALRRPINRAPVAVLGELELLAITGVRVKALTVLPSPIVLALALATSHRYHVLLKF